MEYLKNPWVIGGIGVVLALFFLMRGSGGSGGTGMVSYDQASLDLIGNEAQLNAGIEQAQIAASSQNVATISNAIVNLVNSKFSYMLGSQQVQAGITNAQIASSTAETLDREQQITNRKQIQAGLNLGITQSNNALQATIVPAQIQADTIKSVNSSNNTFGLINNILGAIGL